MKLKLSQSLDEVYPMDYFEHKLLAGNMRASLRFSDSIILGIWRFFSAFCNISTVKTQFTLPKCRGRKLFYFCIYGNEWQLSILFSSSEDL